MKEKKRILIVEDDSSLCNLLKKIMEQTYEVEAFTNSLDAWDWLSAGNFPDLIITDFKMPHVDGLELIEHIRTSGIFQEIPAIILTGQSDPDLAEKKLQWDINAIVSKPFKPDHLIETVDEALKLRNHV